MPNGERCKNSHERLPMQPRQGAAIKEMSREPQFLIAAVRRFLGSDAALPDTEGIDWPVLLRLSDAHAITPMLDSALRDSPIPQVFAEQLRSRFENSVRYSLAQSGELVRLAELFEKHRVSFVALKGPMLSQYLYGTLGTRTSGDIDVLVREQDIPRIRDILVSAGYRLTTTLHWNSGSACLRSRDQEIHFDSPRDVSIDVHWRLMPRYSASVFDCLTGWESLRTVPLAGREIQTLAPEPLLLFLCAHGAKHMFERLGWICDIAQFLHVTPDLDWAAVRARSRRARALRQLSLGVHLAARLFDVPAPELGHDLQVDLLAKTIENRLLAGATPPAQAAESTRYTLRLLETSSRRLRYLVGLYVRPSEAEYRALRLPPPLFFLYYPFRPIRLLWKHAIQQPLDHFRSGRIRQFVELTSRERSLLWRAAALVAAVRLGLWLMPFRALCTLLRRLARRRLSPEFSSVPVRRLAWAVQAVSRRVPDASCLTQALALQCLLARAGHESSIHIGVAKDAGRSFESHAWVECRGEILAGDNGALERYTPILVLREEEKS